MNKILLIDDEPMLRKLVGRILELEGYEVMKTADRRSALDWLRENEAQVILCDVFLPDGNGVEMVAELQQLAPGARIVLLTAHGSIADGVQAIKNGAFDYIVKGDDNRKLIPIVSRAMESAAGEAGKRTVATTPSLQDERHVSSFAGIVGCDGGLKDAVRMAQKVAVTDVPVLMMGETGTGKEVFAQAIHQASRRAKDPFVAVNCSAFSRELLESELFGHRAGAFTGAIKDKKGLFEEAHHGTLFLDEIGEMDVSLQAKLLRVLETGEFIKVGDTRPTRVDVRLLSATNRRLKEEIAQHRFREDLYFRLSVFQITLPPLRERREDIVPLARNFVARLGKKLGLPEVTLAPACTTCLEQYAWPGNVRELQNVIERALIVCEGSITPDTLPVDLWEQCQTSARDSDQPLDLSTVEKEHINRILHYTHGNKTEAARLLRIGLTTLYRKIEEYGIVVEK